MMYGDEQPSEVDLLREYEQNLVNDVKHSRPTCGTCLHWWPGYRVMQKMINDDGTFHGGASGECRALPPSVPSNTKPGEPGFTVFPGFPETASDQGCGMWQLRQWNGNKTRLKP